MDHGARFTAEKLAKRLELVRPLVVRARHPMPEFSLEVLADACADPGQGQMQGPVPWDSYWAGQDTHFVLRTRIEVPAGWSHPALDLPLGVAGDIFTHPEALVTLSDQVLGSSDRYHRHVGIPTGFAGATHDLMLQGWTGLTGWPPDPTDPTRLMMRRCSVVDLDPVMRDFVALAEVALDCARTLPQGRPEAERLLTALDAAFVTLDTRDPGGAALRATVPEALQVLRDGIAAAGAPMDVTLHAIGHAHMDIAYLWPVAQIRRKNTRTYSNVLRLMQDHPDYHFAQSQPQLYDYTAQDTPDLFDAIRARVAEGRWEVLGGMWVEPDVNMPGSEALARQILLGRQYFAQTFGEGAETPVLWLPDTFGFPACLPQLMEQAGLRWFVTNKLNWNQFNRMPASTFWWEGLDGSQVMAHVLTTPREVQHLPFPTNYKSDLSAAEVLGSWDHAQARGATRDLPVCFGYGDGGGGPTDALIRRAQAWSAMPGAPRVRMGTARAALEALERAEGPTAPTWAGELYMEGHRGVLTSQGWIKQANRAAEAALSEAETSIVARWPEGAPPEVRHELTRLWRLLCLNQFHDILTGTAVPKVFADARADFARIMDGARALMQAAQVPGDAGQCVANLSPLASSELLELPAGPPLATAAGPCPEQATAQGRLVALPPRPGRSAMAVQEAAAAGPPPADAVTCGSDDQGHWMQNGALRVRFAATGAVTGICDLRRDRALLTAGAIGNQLTAFEDRPLSWDAWDIDPFFEDRPEDLTPDHAEWIETGPLRATLRVTTRWRNSVITQDIRLMHHSARLQFDTEIDWHEQHILLKTAFPLDLHARQASYDIQWGQIDRPTHRNSPWDAAKFEVAAQRFVTLAEPDFGVSLMNTGKYGHDVRGGTMRLSLVKSSTSPDPGADQGRHRFTYALMPHAAEPAQVQAEARALMHVPTLGAGPEKPPLVTCSAQNVIIETVKPAEDGRGFVLRLYEAEGRRATARLGFGVPVTRLQKTSLLEEDSGALLDLQDGAAVLHLRPFQILTLRAQLD